MSEEINIKELSTAEILELMGEDLYDGYAEEVVEEVEEVLSRKLEPVEILNNGLVAGMDTVGEDFRDGVLFAGDSQKVHRRQAQNRQIFHRQHFDFEYRPLHRQSFHRHGQRDGAQNRRGGD